MQCSLWLLFIWPLCAPGWLAHKCVIYDDAADWPSDTSCPGVLHAASCSGVTELRRDLRGLPADLRTLCVDVDRAKRVHSPLPVGSFAALGHLRHLHVGGCFSRVLNGSFRGLAELRTLTLRHLYVPLDCCEAAVVPAALLDLPRLRTLYLHGYSLRKLPPHVFAGRLPRLAGLFVNATCDDDLAAVVCRLTPLLTSLTELTLAAPLVQELTRHNCSAEGGDFTTSANQKGGLTTSANQREDFTTSANQREDFTTSANQKGGFTISANQREDFTTSANQRVDFTTSANHTAVWLTVGMVTSVEHGALSCFPELTYLSLKMNDQLQEQLNKTAIRKIDLLDYEQTDLSMQDICAVVSVFSIRRVDLHYKNIHFSEFDPDQCKSLEGISFLSNSGLYVPLSIKSFYNFTHLSYLAVEGHTLSTICLSPIPPVPWLTTVSLKFSFLGFIRRHQLSCLSHLTDLELVANGISDIEDHSFEGLGRLRRLRLSFNNISVIREHTFSGLTALETLHLSENPLLNIAEKSFKPFVNLQEFVLRTLGCPLTRVSVSQLNLTHMFSSIPVNLSSLTVFMGPGPMILAAGGVSTTRRPLTLRLVSSSVTIEDCPAPFFRSVTAFLVASRAVRCGSEFIGEHMTNLETFEFLSDFPPRQVDLSSLNVMTRLRRLRLQNLDLLQQPGLGSLLHNLTRLRTLILFNCSLSYLGASLARDLRALTGLLLKSEAVVDVSMGFVQALPSLRYLLIQGLQLYCRCDNAWLADWAHGSEQVEVWVTRPALEELRCLRDDTDSPNFLLYAERECFSAAGCFFFACSSVAVLLLLLVPLLGRPAGPYFLSCYHILRGWAGELGRGAPAYQYDAFVCYSGRDERWVVEQLLPGLERRGPPFLRLCLHSRDFQLGKDVVENITDSLYRSRRTLCLVSRHFLRSHWCSLELRLATYRLQVEHRDVLVLLFLEEIPSRLLTAHHRLARLVKTRTYIHWPQDPARQEAFWDRLWAKLAPTSE